MHEEQDADDRTDQQRLRAGVGAVVHARRILARVVEHRHQHRRARDHQQRRHEQGAQRLPPPQQEAHDERPDQVELLLDRQRPHVLQRRGLRELREVRLAREDETPVRDVPERGERVAADGVDLARRREQRRVGHDAGHHDEQRGQQPSGSPQPEALQVDAPLPVPLRDQQRRDQEAAQHEEGVDAQVAADHPGLARVVEQHRGDREGTDPVQGGLVAEARRRAPAAAPRRRLRRAGVAPRDARRDRVARRLEEGACQRKPPGRLGAGSAAARENMRPTPPPPCNGSAGGHWYRHPAWELLDASSRGSS